MLVKEIKVGQKAIKLRASAAIPRMYRVRFKRDIFQDLAQLSKKMENKADGEEYELSDLTLFENMTYLMAKHADPTLPETPEEWLDGFDGVLDIYMVLPEIIELWGVNVENMNARPNP